MMEKYESFSLLKEKYLDVLKNDFIYLMFMHHFRNGKKRAIQMDG